MRALGVFVEPPNQLVVKGQVLGERDQGLGRNERAKAMVRSGDISVELQPGVRAELPGVSREDINVEMVEDYLTISGSHKSQGEGKAEESFSFSRSVNIPDEVQADKVTAGYENGVLTVTLPKREEAKPKKITVAIK